MISWWCHGGRGNHRADLFLDDDDRQCSHAFQERLNAVVIQEGNGRHARAPAVKRFGVLDPDAQRRRFVAEAKRRLSII